MAFGLCLLVIVFGWLAAYFVFVTRLYVCFDLRVLAFVVVLFV